MINHIYIKRRRGQYIGFSLEDDGQEHRYFFSVRYGKRKIEELFCDRTEHTSEDGKAYTRHVIDYPSQFNTDITKRLYDFANWVIHEKIRTMPINHEELIDLLIDSSKTIHIPGCRRMEGDELVTLNILAVEGGQPIRDTDVGFNEVPKPELTEEEKLHRQIEKALAPIKKKIKSYRSCFEAYEYAKSVCGRQLVAGYHISAVHLIDRVVNFELSKENYVLDTTYSFIETKE